MGKTRISDEGLRERKVLGITLLLCWGMLHRGEKTPAAVDSRIKLILMEVQLGSS